MAEYLTNGKQLWYENDVNDSRVRYSFAGSSDNFYFNGADGKTEAVCLVPYSRNLTYNILGNGDNIGQVKVANDSVSGRYYYLKDHLGSIRMTVGASDNVVGYDDYYPYGMTMTGRSLTPSGEDSRYKFTGKERDASTGLDYFGARYYDSWRGQWLQVDSLRDKYPGWSSYNYVMDNPINLVDSTGNEPGGGDDPSTFVTQYVQNEYNSLWNTDSQKIYNFTYNIVPKILDMGARSTAYWAPEASAVFTGTSFLLTIEKNQFEGGKLSMDSKVGLTTTALGLIPNKAISLGATLLQLLYDSNIFEKVNVNINKYNYIPLRSGLPYGL